MYQRTTSEGAKPTLSRIPVFPAEWQNQFGLPYNEHKQSLQVDILNGYAVYSIKDTGPAVTDKDDGSSESVDETVPPAADQSSIVQT